MNNESFSKSRHIDIDWDNVKRITIIVVMVVLIIAFIGSIITFNMTTQITDTQYLSAYVERKDTWTTRAKIGKSYKTTYHYKIILDVQGSMHSMTVNKYTYDSVHIGDEYIAMYHTYHNTWLNMTWHGWKYQRVTEENK